MSRNRSGGGGKGFEGATRTPRERGPTSDETAARAVADALSHAGSDEALGTALAEIRAVAAPASVLELLKEGFEASPGGRQGLLLSEALHRCGRFREAEEAIRAARTASPDPALFDGLTKRFLPRYQERLRFYACHRGFSFADKQVLEVGGQLPAAFVQSAAPAGWTSLDPKVTEEVREGRYRRLRGDAVETPLPDGSVDLVFSSSAFEHVSDLAGVLAEISRVLRPGGVLYSDFGPIWSSAEGHHLRGAAQEVLRSAELWPLPPWAHLTMTRRQMRNLLSERLGEVERRTVERWLYRRPTINRLFFEDYIHLFHSCPLSVKRIQFKTGPKPAAETARLLRRRHPGRTNFHVKGFRVVLSKQQ